MILMITGGTDHDERPGDLARLSALAPSEVITAGRPGAERMGERWAAPRGILVVRHYPAEDLYGDDASPKRDREMLLRATDLAAFPGPRTAAVVAAAVAAGLTVHDFTAAAALADSEGH